MARRKSTIVLKQNSQLIVAPSFTQLGVTANLGEAILHLKYLDDQFAADGENQAGKSDTAAAFAKSSHNN